MNIGVIHSNNGANQKARLSSAWKKAIEKDGLIWKNHVSDLLGWESPLTKIYKFNEIPYTVLVNKEGKIIAKNLRGKQLENKLSEILK